jgi:hypothetical protein
MTGKVGPFFYYFIRKLKDLNGMSDTVFSCEFLILKLDTLKSKV